MLRQTEGQEMILFSGGYPAPESFPIDIIEKLFDKIIKDPNIFQYQKTEGYQPLLDVLPSFLSRPNRQIAALPENIAITAGSQQGLDIIGRMFINPGDLIAVESPTYVGALQAFNFYRPQYIEVDSDENGIIPESLKKIFNDNPKIKFLYTIPTFQNPTGKTIPPERRLEIAKILQENNKLAIEDDPYSELRFEGDHLPSLQSLAPENVLHLFTFSKTFAPGFRIGGIVGPKQYIEIINKLKQGMVLHTGGLDQALVAEYLAGGHLENHLPQIINLYRPRRDMMISSISDSFPQIFNYTVPQGGLFVWVSLKKEYDSLSSRFEMQKLLEKAKNAGVTFVPGSAFYANPNKNVAMRLNFSNQSEDKIAQGIRILGQLIHQKVE